MIRSAVVALLVVGAGLLPAHAGQAASRGAAKTPQYAVFSCSTAGFSMVLAPGWRYSSANLVPTFASDCLSYPGAAFDFVRDGGAAAIEITPAGSGTSPAAEVQSGIDRTTVLDANPSMTHQKIHGHNWTIVSFVGNGRSPIDLGSQCNCYYLVASTQVGVATWDYMAVIHRAYGSYYAHAIADAKAGLASLKIGKPS